MKKVVSILLALTLLVGLGATASAETYPITKLDREPIELSVFFTEGEIPTEGNKIYKLIEENLGVTFQFEQAIGDSSERVGVMLAGDDLPDLMPYNQQVVDNGGAVALEDYLTQYENIDNHYSRYYGKMKDSISGHIWAIPNWGAVTGDELTDYNWGTGFFIQKAVLAEFGYPTIKTLDEYFDLIEQYVAKYPQINGMDTIGYTICGDPSRNYGLVNPPAFLAGNPNNGNCVVDPTTNTASDISTGELSYRFYAKLNEVYNKGLMDPEACSLTQDAYLTKLSGGNVLGFSDQLWSINSANDALKSAGMPERSYVGIPLTYEADTVERYRDRTVINLLNGFMITTKDEARVQRILQFFNDCLTEEWSVLFNWGIEGEDYMVGEDGRLYCTEEQRATRRDTAWKYSNAANAVYSTMPKLEGTLADGNSIAVGRQPEELWAGLMEYDQEFLGSYGFKTFAEFFNNPPENEVYYPTWQISFETGSIEADIDTKCTDAKMRYLPQAIMSSADEFEAKWQEFVDAYNATGWETRLAYLQEQINWRVENWK